MKRLIRGSIENASAPVELDDSDNAAQMETSKMSAQFSSEESLSALELEFKDKFDVTDVVGERPRYTTGNYDDKVDVGQSISTDSMDGKIPGNMHEKRSSVLYKLGDWLSRGYSGTKSKSGKAAVDQKDSFPTAILSKPSKNTKNPTISGIPKQSSASRDVSSLLHVSNPTKARPRSYSEESLVLVDSPPQENGGRKHRKSKNNRVNDRNGTQSSDIVDEKLKQAPQIVYQSLPGNTKKTSKSDESGSPNLDRPNIQAHNTQKNASNVDASTSTDEDIRIMSDAFMISSFSESDGSGNSDFSLDDNLLDRESEKTSEKSLTSVQEINSLTEKQMPKKLSQNPLAVKQFNSDQKDLSISSKVSMKKGPKKHLLQKFQSDVKRESLKAVDSMKSTGSIRDSEEDSDYHSEDSKAEYPSKYVASKQKLKKPKELGVPQQSRHRDDADSLQLDGRLANHGNSDTADEDEKREKQIDSSLEDILESSDNSHKEINRKMSSVNLLAAKEPKRNSVSVPLEETKLKSSATPSLGLQSRSSELRPVLNNSPRSSREKHDLVKHVINTMPVNKRILTDSFETVTQERLPEQKVKSDESPTSSGSLEGVDFAKKVADSLFDVLEPTNVGKPSGVNDKSVTPNQSKKKRHFGKKMESALSGSTGLDSSNGSEIPAIEILSSASGSVVRNFQTDPGIHKQLFQKGFDEVSPKTSIQKVNSESVAGSETKLALPAENQIPTIAIEKAEIKLKPKQPTPKNVRFSFSFPEEIHILPSKVGHLEAIQYQDLSDALERDETEDFSGIEETTMTDGRSNLPHKKFEKVVNDEEVTRTVSDISFERPRHRKGRHNIDEIASKESERRESDVSKKKTRRKSVMMDSNVDLASLKALSNQNFREVQRPSCFKAGFETISASEKSRLNDGKTRFERPIPKDSLEELKARKLNKQAVDMHENGYISSTPSDSTLSSDSDAIALLKEIKSMMDNLNERFPKPDDVFHRESDGAPSLEMEGSQEVVTKKPDIETKDDGTRNLDGKEPDAGQKVYVRSTSPNIESITIDTKKYSKEPHRRTDNRQRYIPDKNSYSYPISRPPRAIPVPMIARSLPGTFSIPGVRSVTATTSLGNSSVKTVYHFGPTDTELIEVFVDDELRAKIVKDDAHDAYRNVMKHSDFPQGSNASASTVIVANGCEMRADVFRKGNKETIAVYKNGELLCKTGNSVIE